MNGAPARPDRLLPRPAIGAAVSACAAALLYLCACESRVVNYNTFLSGLPRSEQAMPYENAKPGYHDPTRIPEDKIVQGEGPDRKLVAKNGRHLMIHIYTTVDEGERDLFFKQVLSRRTAEACIEKGHDPRLLFDFLKYHQADMQALFRAMPMGELTPGLLMVARGDGVYRVQIERKLAEGMPFDGFDMVMEGGNWRLVWFTGPGALVPDVSAQQPGEMPIDPDSPFTR